MIFSWPFKDASDGDKKITREDERRIIAQFKEWLPRILAVPEVQAMITFEQVVNYLQSDRPPSSAVNKSVVIRQNHANGQLLGLVFLDQNNSFVCRPDGTPYGRQLLARKLDGKLQQNLGNKDLMLVDIQSQKSGFEEFHRSITNQYQQWLRDILKLPEILPIMTYEAAIQYFVTDRPADPRIEKGAIIRQPHSQGQLLAQVFLDSNNDLVRRSDGKPYGRQLVAKKLDEELLDAFGNKNLIIVE